MTEVLLKNVPIALADMHECEPKKNVKKLKGHCRSGNDKRQNYQDQPRSAFHFFMEEFVKTWDHDENEVDLDRKGFEKWKNMLEEERHPYVLQAEKVNSAYNLALLKEENDVGLSWIKQLRSAISCVTKLQTVDDEADSAEVGKYDKNYEGYEFYVDSENSDSYGIFWSETSESLGSKLRARMWPRIVEKSS